jgi:hypothetical protein
MKIKPDVSNRFDLLLTFQTQVSHHDPAVGDGSNTLTFNRQLQTVERDVAAYALAQQTVDAFCETHPVPLDLQPVFAQCTFQEFTADALVRLMLDTYNSPDGVGVFSGMDRYEKLESRVRAAATRSFSLRGFWARLCRDLQLPIHGGDTDAKLLAFYALPRGLQQDVLALLVREYRSAVTIARAWHAGAKLAIDFYADAVGAETQTMVVMAYDASVLGGESHEIVTLDVPAVSANSLRHQIVREPGWVHLVSALGLTDVPPGVEALFINGGNIRAGAKSPTNAAQLALAIRQMYPLLDLLGGNCDSFDLGEGRLSVAGWVVCRENADAIAGTSAESLPLADMSIFDMLDDVTHTRQATEEGLGQMIWNFETLAKGLNILVKLDLHPFTSDVTRAALFAAVEQFRQHPTIAGQSARGFGWCKADWLGDVDADTKLYADYLAANQDALVEGIVGGQMGTGAQIFLV